MRYQQPQAVQAVILDWAGTVIDFGSFAPTRIFVEAFAGLGMSVGLGLGERNVAALLGESEWPSATQENPALSSVPATLSPHT